MSEQIERHNRRIQTLDASEVRIKLRDAMDNEDKCDFHIHARKRGDAKWIPALEVTWDQDKRVYVFEPIEDATVISRGLIWTVSQSVQEETVAPHIKRLTGGTMQECEFYLEELESKPKE